KFSLAEFAQRGGKTGLHIDGWGIAFFRDGDAAIIREPEPSAHSALLQFIHDQHTPSALVLSHIRKATQGAVNLRNTQPFMRELGGRPHVFAHNGDLGDLRARIALQSHFRSIGDTDSEHAFCYLLAQMQPLWAGVETPSLERRLRVFTRFCTQISAFGAANFLYSDGDYLFVHAHHRRQDNGDPSPAGLYLLERRCHEHDMLNGVNIESDQQMTLLASRPLSAENWQPLPAHTVLVIQHGRVVVNSTLTEYALKAN
ncbi:MAG TPA: class II glutamine amidotransferase, partial [Spongiibacteraceae bacterium]|nr:class II glutamine amidotransferase [Spongiibacteraceae bacterium]